MCVCVCIIVLEDIVNYKGPEGHRYDYFIIARVDVSIFFFLVIIQYPLSVSKMFPSLFACYNLSNTLLNFCPLGH